MAGRWTPSATMRSCWCMPLLNGGRPCPSRRTGRTASHSVRRHASWEGVRLELSKSRRVAVVGLALAVLFGLAGCAVDRIRGDAEQMIVQGDFEHAVQALEAGVARYP